MKRYKKIINCKKYNKLTKRNNSFVVVRYIFNYQTNKEDKVLIDSIIKKGLKLAKNVNKGAASNSITIRNQQQVKNNAISGLLAEYVWKDILKYNDIEVAETNYEKASNQIDLYLTKIDKTIEVRSSFPRNGIEFALCHHKYQFDVIGPYFNEYKPNEIQKDFYVRVLYPIQSKDFFTLLKRDNFEVFLTGGATWSMISNDNIVKIKSFIPEDEINLDRLSHKTNYRVLPFSQALDTLQIIKKMKFVK